MVLLIYDFLCQTVVVSAGLIIKFLKLGWVNLIEFGLQNKKKYIE